MDNKPYSYTDAGFNGFYRRSIDRNQAVTLSDMATTFQMANNNQTNFDAQQITGSIGNTLQVGKRARIDGVKGRFAVTDDNGEEVARFGDLSE